MEITHLHYTQPIRMISTVCVLNDIRYQIKVSVEQEGVKDIEEQYYYVDQCYSVTV